MVLLVYFSRERTAGGETMRKLWENLLEISRKISDWFSDWRFFLIFYEIFEVNSIDFLDFLEFLVTSENVNLF